ncbi:MAG: DUF177 domain-containing protein [Pseudomonadota bacterium]
MNADTPPLQTGEPEFSRLQKTRALAADPVKLEANADECALLAKRFGIAAIKHLTAQVSLEKTGAGISAKGPLEAHITQTCAVSGEDFRVTIKEELDLIFVEEAVLASRDAGEVNEDGAIEINLFADEADEIGYSGDTFDLGEAVAQSLGLAIDPYAEGPDADAARQDAGIADETAPSGPLADALSEALKKK